MNFCPPKPGSTVIIKTISTKFIYKLIKEKTKEKIINTTEHFKKINKGVYFLI